MATNDPVKHLSLQGALRTMLCYVCCYVWVACRLQTTHFMTPGPYRRCRGEVIGRLRPSIMDRVRRKEFTPKEFCQFVVQRRKQILSHKAIPRCLKPCRRTKQTLSKPKKCKPDILLKISRNRCNYHVEPTKNISLWEKYPDSKVMMVAYIYNRMKSD